jgi:flavin reductase (DIM6/NTAB) family NADH-FMN oxidoreductase RutF
MEKLPPAQQYKLLSSTVVPRPIALVTTRSVNGHDNAAPYSFFNALGEDPPVLVLGLQENGDRTLKDTTVNIRDTGQFVVHMVDEAIAERMNVCAVDFPSGVNECEAAGLTLVPSDRVRPPRIAESPVAFECEKIALIQVSAGRHIALGKAITMHVRENIIDPKTLRIDTEAYRPIGRLFGSLYTHTQDQFEMRRESYEDWLSRKASTA